MKQEASPERQRIVSIDALRGLAMFTMIFVNDLAGVSPSVVPWWMRHFKPKSDGMTFVDLVFPGFLFIVGMSIPFALGPRIQRGDPPGRILMHILYRTGALLVIGIMMVNELPDPTQMGWSANLWSTLMFSSAILAFSSVTRPGSPKLPTEASLKDLIIPTVLRVLGMVSLLILALVFRGSNGHQIIAFNPFSIHTEWYGILGLIGWAYLVGATVYLLFSSQRTALLGCMVLLLCFYPAERSGFFDNFWLAHYVGFGGTLGSQASITVAGILLASILTEREEVSLGARVRFTLLFMGGCAAGAFLLRGLYGIDKNSATPSWCLWACVVTAGLWLILYLRCDVRPPGAIVTKLALAGENVLLAYLLSEMLPSALDLVGLGGFWDRLASPNLACAIARSAGCALGILILTRCINRVGFRLKL